MSAPIRQQVEGLVRLKRKSQWVSRYAQIKNAIFQYKDDRNSMQSKRVLDLR